MNKRVNAAIIIGLIMTFVWGGNLIMSFAERDDIWWTPSNMRLPAAQCRDKVRIYLQGAPLEDAVDRGAVYTTDQNGQLQGVRPEDVTLRVNNWDAHRATVYGRAVVYSAFTTAGILLLLFGLFFWPRAERAEENDAGS